MATVNESHSSPAIFAPLVFAELDLEMAPRHQRLPAARPHDSDITQ